MENFIIRTSHKNMSKNDFQTHSTCINNNGEDVNQWDFKNYTEMADPINRSILFAIRFIPAPNGSTWQANVSLTITEMFCLPRKPVL